MASQHWKGDFRRISQQTWETITSLYPGSGPAITFDYAYSRDTVNEQKENNADLSNTAAVQEAKSFKRKIENWKILNPPPPPDIDNSIFTSFTFPGKSTEMTNLHIGISPKGT